MAPSVALDLYSPSLHFFTPRAASNPDNPPLASVFALIINRSQAVATTGARAVIRSLRDRSNSRSTQGPNLAIEKRQQQILVIPTTYANLNDSPAPGAVVGITLGAILGFILALFLFLFILKNVTGFGGGTVVEEEIIRRHSQKRSATVSSSSTSAAPPPRPPVETRRESRTSRQSRRTSRRESRREPEMVTVEEEMTVSDAPEVVVEEEEDDIVEVIEEHSPEPPPRRKKKSGHYRTVDPAEFGGGDGPNRRVSRRGE